ncbi:MAG: AAA family ATPase [Clostridia bacterium]|nr:AAA family ATPase [Clostridia bacterium]
MYCILLAGMPATGKSSLAKKLSAALTLPVFSKDVLKERLFDTIGFQSRAEKVRLGEAASRIIEDCADEMLRAGIPFILENNFDDVTWPTIQALFSRYDCIPLTILLTADMQTVYDRFVARDQSPLRHRGHVVNNCYPEKEPRTAVVPLPFEGFAAAMAARGFDRFDIGGPTLRVDTTDWSQVELADIIAWVRDQITFSA